MPCRSVTGMIRVPGILHCAWCSWPWPLLVTDQPYSHSIANKPEKASSDAGFEGAISVNTMKNTMFKICC